ncbi:Rha family transcriptional regulator [Clostridium botulinum]|uniref:Phage regulatory protein n=2 Tax=Clostridium botulinum TaxID=1491 RepID=A0A9Q1UWC1_CLOBO|nr:Rha family transcriptional regulator [Clostridium botulinum]EDS76587.1 conserved hypothetical protein [Clostridium botulinum C str. Eklund]AEB77245.1 conserved hypothetical protein [Clostridium botulinum BKT015925]KEH96247.1 hypothetical protein Y848_13220 [Clostridium botulinum C/D str. Sp77]KLU74347.1 hypothetical protein CBC3_p0045 [Clostridium botulinum V891]KOA80439.1 hypothetical protein ADU77_01195 [Clostridium botulinum]
MVKKKNKKDKNGLMITFNNERKSVLSGESWVYTDSLNLAEVLNTEHKEVLKRIRKVLKDYKIEDGELNSPSSEAQEYIHKHTDFTYSILYYKNSQNKLQPYYRLSKDLLVLVIFSFRKLSNAQELQKLYIARFNEMEKELNWYKARYLGIATRNYMTDCIRDYYNIEKYKTNKNPYVMFTNLVYETLYGSNAFDLRKDNNLPKGKNIRPWLTDEEVKVVDKLEQEIGTLISYDMGFKEIKKMIDRKYSNVSRRNIKLLKVPRE